MPFSLKHNTLSASYLNSQAKQIYLFYEKLSKE